MLECDGESIKFCVSDRPGPFRLLGSASPAELKEWLLTPDRSVYSEEIENLRLTRSEAGVLIVEWDVPSNNRSANFSLRDVSRCWTN